MSMSWDDYILQSGLMPNPSPVSIAKKAALLALVATSCACAQKPPLFIDVTDQPAWVVDAFDGAADFWALHDIEVNVGEFEDGIRVEVATPEEVDGNFAHWDAPEVVIRVSDRLETIEDPRNANLPTCILAHEIGHALGMKHVSETGSKLMARVAQAPPAEGCWWSVDDQLELCRVTGCTEEE